MVSFILRQIRPTTNVLQRASNVAKSAAEHNNQFEQESTAKFRMKEDSKAQINSTLKHATTVRQECSHCLDGFICKWLVPAAFPNRVIHILEADAASCSWLRPQDSQETWG